MPANSKIFENVIFKKVYQCSQDEFKQNTLQNSKLDKNMLRLFYS